MSSTIVVTPKGLNNQALSNLLEQFPFEEQELTRTFPVKGSVLWKPKNGAVPLMVPPPTEEVEQKGLYAPDNTNIS